jgi:hypothetical protein
VQRAPLPLPESARLRACSTRYAGERSDRASDPGEGLLSTRVLGRSPSPAAHGASKTCVQLDRDDLASVVSVGVVIDRDFERNLAVKAGLAITSIERTPGPSISSLAADCGSGTDLSR